ncbi:MAG TPA: hypothetical protein VN837_05755 [Chloroflexota bacterium]|nr:hypothetical protein [Chloroflexota bacterium]
MRSPVPSPAAGERAAPRRRPLLVWLCLFVFLLYLLSAGSNFASGDTLSELRVSQSLVSHGGFDVPIVAAHTLCAGWGCRGLDGHYFASHGIGFSLFLLPFYGLAQAALALVPAPRCVTWDSCVPIHLISWSNCLLGALTVALLCVLCLDLGYPRRRALFLAILYGFGTLAWPYARFAFDVTPTALLLLACFHQAVLGAAASEGTRRWWSAGILAALAVLVRLPTIPALIPVALWAVLAPSDRPAIRWRRLAAFSLPVAVSLAFSGWYNLVRFGGILNDGHATNAADRLLLHPWVGIVGMTISPGKGLLWYSPTILFALVALPRFYARHRATARVALSMALLSLVPYLFVPDWYGGDAWGPRFVLPVLPLLMLPAVECPPLLLATWRRRAAAAVVILWSLTMQVTGQLVSYPLRLRAAERAGISPTQLAWDPRHTPILDQLGTLITYIAHPSWAAMSTARAQSFDIWWLNLWRNDGLPRTPVLIAALVILALALAAGSRLVREVRRPADLGP